MKIKEPDFRYYSGLAKLENSIGGEVALKSEIFDLVNESEAYIKILKEQIEELKTHGTPFEKKTN